MQYRCNVTDTNGSVTSNTPMILSVTGSVQITLQPINQSVTAPASANFSVTASGISTLTYRWQYSTNSGGTWTSLLADGGVYTGTQTNALHISNSTGLNGNYYRCIVTATNGTVNSNAGVLTVS